MAINAYVGLQGSGKSYEVVSSVILDAIKAGRRVVTNVDGINETLIHAYLVEKHEADETKLGKVLHVSNDRITQPQFFPDEDKPELEAVVLGGDLVAIDEAWRFWGTESSRIPAEHMQFFRMHRHFTHPETGVTCDVVLMTQDISGLRPSVRNVIEFSFRMVKLKSLGLNKNYRVEIYEGWKQNSKTRIDDRQKRYDPAIFPLYKSYSGGNGKENAIDSRQNILANKRLWAMAAFFIVLMSFGAWNTWRFFNRNPAASSTTASAATTPGAAGSPMQTAPKKPAQPDLSDKWRLVGRFQANEESWVVIADTAGRLRLESPSAFTGTGLVSIGEVDGEKVSAWTGNQPGAVHGVNSEVVR